MTLDVTLPRGGMGVLKIGHEDFGARVQRVDDHFSFYRAGDLYAAVQEILGNGSYSPLAVTDMLGFGEEIGQFAGVDLGLSLHPALQEFLAPVSEGTDQGCNEVHSIRCQYLGKLRSNGAADLDPRRVVGQVVVGHRITLPSFRKWPQEIVDYKDIIPRGCRVRLSQESHLLAGASWSKGCQKVMKVRSTPSFSQAASFSAMS